VRAELFAALSLYYDSTEKQRRQGGKRKILFELAKKLQKTTAKRKNAGAAGKKSPTAPVFSCILKMIWD
jgi:hypothetical protein